MMSSPASYLCIDDDDVWRRLLTGALTRRGALSYEAHSAKRALEVLTELAEAGEPLPTRVVCDLKMPEVDGLALLPELKARLPEALIIILTGYGSVASAVMALKLGAHHMMMKPVSTDELTRAFDELATAEREGEAPTPSLDLKEAPSLARVEWEHIQRVLQECEGNISHAARVLGLHRRTLQRKLQVIPPTR